MDALVMCGGEGSRLESDREKPLFPIDGVAMVDRVLAALAESVIETTYAVVSPNAPETRAHVGALEEPIPIETPGAGYVSDLQSALACEQVSPPVLTVAADLPLLEGSVIDRVCAIYEGSVSGDGDEPGSLAVCVPVALERRLGVRDETGRGEHATEHLVPTGVNAVGNGPRQMRYTSYDPRLAVNVNRRSDARVAEDRCTHA